MKIPSLVEVQQILKKTELAKTLSEKELELLLENIRVISYSKGETIFKQGTVINDYGILMSGLCKITVENLSNGNGTIISLVQPVKFLNISTIEDTIYHGTATAMVDSVVAFVSKDTVFRLMQTNAKFSYGMFVSLFEYSKNLIRMTVDFSQKSIMSRVASSLLYIAEMTNGKYIDLPISRNDLAEISGIATGSTIRLLGELEKLGVIVLDKKTILIKDVDVLKKISLQD